MKKTGGNNSHKNLGKVRRQTASAMAAVLTATSILPAYAWAAPKGASKYNWYIMDTDENIDDEDEDTYATSSNASKATASNASSGKATASNATASNATASNALAMAVRSFNRPVQFVDENGDVIEGDEKNIPETSSSYPYLSQTKERTKGGIDLSDYGYVENEYFLAGNANVYQAQGSKLATKSDADYVDRVIVFKPENPDDFNGTVYVEILNASSGVDLPDIWRRSYEYFMREGCIYVGVTSKSGNVDALKKFDKDRYKALKWTNNGIIWDILGQVGAELKRDGSTLLYGDDGDGADACYLIGQSQSGFYVNTFNNYFGEANYLVDPEYADAIETGEDVDDLYKEGADHIYDGILNVVGGAAAMPVDIDKGSFQFGVPNKASRIPFILLVGENDYNPSIVRKDSDEPEVDMYRHYVFAGGAHSSKIFLPDMKDEIQMKAGRPAGDYVAFKKDTRTGRPNTNTDLDMDVFVNAALHNLDEWANGSEVAPYGPTTDEVHGKMTSSGYFSMFVPERDENGNMDSGILSPQVRVPVGAYYGGANGAYSTDGGSMVYFDDETIENLYTDREDYLEKYAEALDEAIAEGWILEEDRERMMRHAENEPIFGNPGVDDEEIEDSMKSAPTVAEKNRAQQTAGNVSYTDTEYQLSGKANVYGIQRENSLYRRRMYRMDYTNYARVCVPENFKGEVVVDLILDGEQDRDVSSYMKAGKAYVGITADPSSAKAKGGNWEILSNNKGETKRTELGLRWDIISQTITAIRDGGFDEAVSGDKDTLKIVLGLDSKERDLVYTYQQMFGKFDAYSVETMSLGKNAKLAAMNELDQALADKGTETGLWSSVIQYQENGSGEPVIGATAKDIIEKDGKYFKDSNGNGVLDAYEDWRLDAETRAKDLVSQMSIDDKIGMMFNNSRGMGINAKEKDSTGLLDETEKKGDTSIFGQTETLGTTATIEELKLRHFILRQNPEPEDMASWINQMNYVAEGTDLGIPVLVSSNSRNENGQMTFGMNDASGVFSTWPGTLGLAAAAKGDLAAGKDASLISQFAEIGKSEWDASGLKKGYMYMVDTMTDPRWQRTYGTFGEDPNFIADAAERLVVGFQGSSEGVQPDGVALTIKHFPGGGARENGFDPHYKQGQWNVYQTEDSLRKYHLPGFEAAVDNHVSSIMPYYAKPAPDKSEPQYDKNGKQLSMQQVGFAFNKEFIQGLLRDQMGHEGYVNSDSGIINNMAWGVEKLDVPERAAYAVNAGTDIIGDTNDVWSMREAYERSADGSKSDYYDTHEIAYGFTKDDVTVTEEALNQANERLLKEMFELGLFENPYRDPDEAKATVDTPENWDAAYEAHQKSVVLLKNKEEILPLSEKKLNGKRVYVEYFSQNGGSDQTEALRKNLESKYQMTLTDDYADADYAILFVNPSSGNYFSATAGYLELDICDGKTVHNVDEEGRPVAATHEETTLKDAGKIQTIADAVHANGGKVITNVNFTLAWLLGNVEPYSDAVLAGFDTYADATMDVMTGKYQPSGKMPITLPKNDDVIAVNADGVCVSRNDVPGYAKDQYMPESMKDENGKAYAYRDSEGNYYELNYGLTYSSSPETPDEPGKPDKPDKPANPDHGNTGDNGNGGNSGTSTGHGGGSGNGSGRSHATSTGNVSASVIAVAGDWMKNEQGSWTFKMADGTMARSAWIPANWNGSTEWYYFNEDATMAVGWIQLDGQWYYLSDEEGNRGRMYTGWHQIGGKWYYFHMEADGTRGRLLTSTTTPDGYQVDANGVWNENK